ncbi:unnamed protein product [Vitrella brassicaformis CCMP3155]|uniref:Uncharacterized protein n=2 Tax=Vitrella brassicaformis TaxID=1169539 RepID=A0A0G4H855_VITBC|nr:unnamed protein product [Vitrella brassicaformis CCMP3155]|eukprot:CEM40077.1 unnamed protein product [Vitrella brassicaformis CCMP3155]
MTICTVDETKDCEAAYRFVFQDPINPDLSVSFMWDFVNGDASCLKRGWCHTGTSCDKYTQQCHCDDPDLGPLTTMAPTMAGPTAAPEACGPDAGPMGCSEGCCGLDGFCHPPEDPICLHGKCLPEESAPTGPNRDMNSCIKPWSARECSNSYCADGFYCIDETKLCARMEKNATSAVNCNPYRSRNYWYACPAFAIWCNPDPCPNGFCCNNGQCFDSGYYKCKESNGCSDEYSAEDVDCDSSEGEELFDWEAAVCPAWLITTEAPSTTTTTTTTTTKKPLPGPPVELPIDPSLSPPVEVEPPLPDPEDATISSTPPATLPPPPDEVEWETLFPDNQETWKNETEVVPDECQDTQVMEGGSLDCDSSEKGLFVRLAPASTVGSVKGSRHPDQIYGSMGSNFVDGGEGTDLIDGGGGDDTLMGGGGTDLFVMSSNPGNATVLDFEIGRDRIDLRRFAAVTSFESVEILEGSAIIYIDSTHQMVLKNVQPSDITPDAFFFAIASDTDSTSPSPVASSTAPATEAPPDTTPPGEGDTDVTTQDEATKSEPCGAFEFGRSCFTGYIIITVAAMVLIAAVGVAIYCCCRLTGKVQPARGPAAARAAWQG